MFKPYDQKQNFLLPPSFQDFLGEGHKAIVLSEIIDGLDFSTLLSSYENTERGTSAYHPVMLVKVLFYGYMNSTFSSRKLAEKIQSDIAFMFLSGGNKPDFRTIARFRKEKGRFLTSIFVQIVRKAQELGIISFSVVSIDGTKVYADASKNKNADLETLERQMKKLLEEADKIDAMEENELGEDDDGSGIPEELKTKEGREKKRKEIAEKKKKVESKKEAVKKEIETKAKEGITMTRINSTDKDSRLMQMKRKDFANGYNPQIATENQFILATTINNATSDIRELIPVLKVIEENFGTKPEKVLADKGYASMENYDYLQKKKIDGYIPHPEFGQDQEGWKYSEKKDEYTNLDGNIYTFKQYIRGKKGGEEKRGRGRPRKDEIIHTSDYQSKIYQTKMEDGKKKYISINKNWNIHCKSQDDKFSTTEGKELYKKRCYSVEPVFGNIKRNLKFERFSLRGLKGVTIEWNLITMVHNLKKIMNFRPV